MFNNEAIAADKAEATADEAMQNGMTEEAAIDLYEKVYAEELERLNTWVANNVGLD